MTFDLGTFYLRRGTYARVLYPHHPSPNLLQWSFRRHRQARDGASRHLLQPSLPQVGRPRLVPHVKIMHYILMVILSVLLLCFATDSWSSFLFFYHQECARTSYRPPSWVSKPYSNAPPR